MAVFTDIADWTSAQDTAAANEIVLAYSERRQCVGHSAVDPLDAGDNAQDTAFWKGMQDWVKTQVDPTSGNSKWIDHTQTIEGEESLPYYTLPSFKYNSGLAGGDDSGEDRVVGFRRATEWPTDWTDYEDAAYSYGPIEAGDIRGPWIFEDLQAAFDAMRWTVITGDNTDATDREDRIGDGNDEASHIDAWTEAESNYDASSWETEWGTDIIYRAIAYSRQDIYDLDYYACLYRTRGKPYIINVPDHLYNTSHCYIITQITQGVGWDEYNNTDYESGIIYLLSSLGSEQATTRTFAKPSFDDYPYPSDYDNEVVYAASVSVAYFVFKWAFTNTL
jgi:hypothetical protein